MLRLIPHLHEENAWTEADKKSVGTHFAHLQAATTAGKVVLAGRTMEPGDKTFGHVIFEAADEPAARCQHRIVLVLSAVGFFSRQML